MALVEIERGDIWWADVPGDKVRPVVILTRQRFIPYLTNLLVAPVTTTIRSIPTEVPLGQKNGLPRDCAANFDNVFTLSRNAIRERIGTLDDDQLADVCRAYRFAAGC